MSNSPLFTLKLLPPLFLSLFLSSAFSTSSKDAVNQQVSTLSRLHAGRRRARALALSLTLPKTIAPLHLPPPPLSCLIKSQGGSALYARDCALRTLRIRSNAVSPAHARARIPTENSPPPRVLASAINRRDKSRDWASRVPFGFLSSRQTSSRERAYICVRVQSSPPTNAAVAKRERGRDAAACLYTC